MTEIKKNTQLKLGIKYNRGYIFKKVTNYFTKINNNFKNIPYWKSIYSWLSLSSSLVLGLNSLLVIYFNFEYLPSRIAMMFAEKVEEDIVKDKYLLYFLPILTILLGISITILSGKLFSKFPQTIKFLSIITFLLSLIQLIAVYKIINIYL